MDDLRTRMLEAAESLLNASPDRDISTRAVCDAVGVGAPTLYRQFGDKNGLLSAVVDHGFDRYLSIKRAARPSADPVADLTEGWNSHVAFALAHPAVYRLMYSPSFDHVPKAAEEALGLLRDVLERCAEVGRLRIAPDLAAQTIMSANIGVTLNMLTQPDTYTDPELPHRVRDAIFAAVLTDPPKSGTVGDLGTAAVQLATKLKTTPPGALTEAETGLLHEWLARISKH